MSELASASSAQLAATMRATVMKFARRMRSERADESIGQSALLALTTVHDREPLTASALAQFERLQPSSLTRIIASLEERGLIARQRHPEDGRQTLLSTTLSGRKIVLAERERRQEWLAHMLDGLSEGERDALRVALPIIARLGSQDRL
jgi:DNA-binding MarR family transcriptional regulator